MPFPIGGPGTKPLSLTVFEIFNVKCNAMVDVTLIQPLNKGQGHSFRYQSISYIRLPIVTPIRCRRITFGHRAFSVAFPMVWNSLPTEFRDLSVGFGVFRRTVKTILFARY